MSENERDYSDYIQHMSNVVSGLFALGGFIFTAITILLTQLPNPNTLQSQLVLLFLAVFFDLLMFVSSFSTVEMIYHCRDIPPLTRRIRFLNALLTLVANLSGFAVSLLFLLWNLTMPAIVSGLVWGFLVIAIIFLEWKPFQEYRKTASK